MLRIGAPNLFLSSDPTLRSENVCDSKNVNIGENDVLILYTSDRVNKRGNRDEAAVVSCQ